MGPDISHPDAIPWADAGAMIDMDPIMVDFNGGLDTNNNNNNNNNIIIASKPPPVKQLACVRCHSQKLRCVRRAAAAAGRNDGKGCCDRCLSAGANCVERQPQRMGRPVDQATRSQTLASDASSGRGGGHRRPHMTAERWRRRSTNHTLTAATRQTTTNPAGSPCPELSIDYGGGAVTAASFNSVFPAGPDLDGWPWPSPPQDPSSGNSSIATGAQDNGMGSNGSSASSKPASLGTGRGAESFLNDFEDLPANFLSSINDNTANGPADHGPMADPIEELSRLHLELYQCLTLVKLVDKLKKERLRDRSAQPDEAIDTNWSEQLFRRTERFIEAVKTYVNDTPSFTAETCTDTMGHESPESCAKGSRAVAEGGGGIETGTGTGTGGVAQVDSATGLLIVSCYMRLIQIFEVVVFVVETFTEMDCPGNYVQIRFGSFVPKTDKIIHARLLGQYVLHLLEGISEAVDSAVASRQPYARAIADVRQAEAKLKERVVTTLS